MRVADLLSRLYAANVDLWVDGDRLRFSAPKGVLTPDLRAALVEHRDAVMEFLRRASTDVAPVPPITPVARDRDLPLSFPQRRIW
ncbi:MAG TPA: hypothetical protein VFX70_03285, partial [Mycobacteriales bacterium]|nr:hypothetical protein [Mycobacteriales bacterium]